MNWQVLIIVWVLCISGAGECIWGKGWKLSIDSEVYEFSVLFACTWLLTGNIL